MRAIERCIVAALCVAAAQISAFCASVGEGEDGTKIPVLSAEIRHEEGPGLLPADRAYLTAGTNRFAFLVPPGFRPEASNEHTFALVTRDYACQITFRIAAAVPADTNELDKNAWGARVLAEHPGARIVKEFSGFADCRGGPAFEIELPGPGGVSRRGEVFFVPSRAVVLEFALSCRSEDFPAGRQKLNTIMLTFRSSDSRGELHIPPLSDKL